VLRAVGEDANEAATELLKTLTPARIESWTHSEPKDWANESFAIAEQAQTKNCIRQGASCEHTRPLSRRTPRSSGSSCSKNSCTTTRPRSQCRGVFADAIPR
jgi:hypothetical protein